MGKIFANLLCCFVPVKSLRHKIRKYFNERGIETFIINTVECKKKDIIDCVGRQKSDIIDENQELLKKYQQCIDKSIRW